MGRDSQMTCKLYVYKDTMLHNYGLHMQIKTGVSN